MTKQRQENQEDMHEFEAALKELYDESPSALAGMASIITKEKEAKTYLFGETDAVEALLMSFIKYSADKEGINVFEKILSMQTKLMQVHPDMYRAYAEKLNQMKERGDF